jgi:hypothetical protein
LQIDRSLPLQAVLLSSLRELQASAVVGLLL